MTFLALLGKDISNVPFLGHFLFKKAYKAYRTHKAFLFLVSFGGVVSLVSIFHLCQQ